MQAHSRFTVLIERVLPHRWMKLGQSLLLLAGLAGFNAASAQTAAGDKVAAKLVHQGARLLNVDGALRLAAVLRTDNTSAIDAGKLSAGTNLLANGKVMPKPSSVINGQTVKWSQFIVAGGRQLLGGTDLFTKYQPFYDPSLAWAGKVLRKRSVVYRTGSIRTYPQYFSDVAAPNQTLVTPGVRVLTALAGTSSWVGRTGVFTPSATLAGWATSGATLSQGMGLSNGGALSEGVVLSESGNTATSSPDDKALGEP